MYTETRINQGAVHLGVGGPKPFFRILHADSRMAQRARVEIRAQKEVSRKGSQGYIEDETLSDLFLNSF